MSGSAANSSKLILVLGNGPVADETVNVARQRGHTVVYGRANNSDSSTRSDQDIPLEITNYDSFVSIFQQTINRYHKIDTLILCFSPSQPSNDIYTHTTLDETVYPFTKAVKLIFFHWRRDPLLTKAGQVRRVVFLGQYPQEIAAGSQTAYGGILGLYRSTLFRFNVLGIKPEFVSAPYDAELDLVVDALLGSSSQQRFEYGTVYKFENNSIISQDPSIGTFTAPQSTKLGIRFVVATWLIERITAMVIYTKGMTRNSSLPLNFAVTLITLLLAYLATGSGSPWLGLFAGLLEARFGTVRLVLGDGS